MAARPQLWIKRMALTVDASSVQLPFPHDDPPELTPRRYADSPQLVPGSIRRFRVDLDTATATGDWRFRVFKNGTGTALDLTITQGNTTAGATADTDVVTFSQYDLLRIDIDASTGSATAKPWTFTMEFTPTVAGERSYGGGHMNFLGDNSDPALVYKQNPFFPRNLQWGEDSLAEYKTENCAIGQDGTITNFLIYYQIDMTSGSYEFKLWKCPAASDPSVIANYVAQDGAGGTVDTRTTMDGSSPTISDSGSTARTYALGSFSLPVAKGDFIYITADRTAGDQFPTDSVGLRGMVFLKFVADDTTTWFISGAATGLGSVFANYIAPMGDRALVDSSTTTTGINVGPFGGNGAIFTGAIFWVEDDPNTGNDRAFELYNAGVVTDIAVTISGTAKTANDNGSATVSSGNSIYIKHTPTSVPDDNIRVWFTYFGTSNATATAFAQWR